MNAARPPSDDLPAGVSRGRPEVPPPLRVAAGLAGVEGVVLLLYGIAELVATSRERLAMGITTGAAFVGFGVLLVVCAAALARAQLWARGPILLTQLIQLGLAWSFRDLVGVAVAMALVAALVLAGLLHPASLKALEQS